MSEEAGRSDIEKRLIAVEKDVEAVEKDIGLLREDLSEDRKRAEIYRTGNAEKIGEIHDWIVSERAKRAQLRRLMKLCAGLIAAGAAAVGIIKGVPLDGNGK